MFRKSAAYYDLIYQELKDYPDECLRLDYILRQFEPRPHRLLDVGCGTGEHARLLSENFGYEVDGIDIEPAFIEIASKKLPLGDFTVADMCNFSLPRRYDAILCLFSSIGYLETEKDLAAAFLCMADHLEPGGWLICEPWTTPENWKPGQIDAVEAHDPDSQTTITRTRFGETDGNVSVLRIEYDISSPAGDKQIQETHRLGLFSQAQLSDALSGVGFSAKWAQHGLHNGSLILATYTP